MPVKKPARKAWLVLTPEERNLLSVIRHGCTPTQAARSLGVTLPHVRALLQRLQARYGVCRLNALIVRAIIGDF